ncbi:aminoacyl-tRNA hydrolase [Kineobactrum salinum]|uniref:Peptidyl-tRNA hydrolase n=1 Tax=Kineobactrum salinum TaxID=2708301 RepID=A0A6C0U5I3_9GAMM|nr:aminoacyl-tRNA hydrolase [Kineobactrum salinum]QIB64704.1 aminoacyl-tRNA hydrolase [Kineobactrum salinum]
MRPETNLFPYFQMNTLGRKRRLVMDIIARLFIYSGAWIYRRLNPQITVIGITGSAGKTTTKDLCSIVLGEFGPCVNTPKSMNRRPAVARTVLKFRPKTRYSVLELSGTKPGHLDLLIQISRPNIAVVTIVGRDHYSAFKSVEAIAEEKSKLVARLPRNGVAVLNIDDPLVRKMGEQCRRHVIWIGRDANAALRLLDVHSRWPQPLTLTVQYQDQVFQIPTGLHGEHLALSVLATLGVGLAAGLSLPKVIEIIGKVEPTEGRMEIITDNAGVTFVRDDWKAPHWSIGAPFDFMTDATAARKIVIMGTISDSSESPSKRYPKVARQIREFADFAVFVGPDSSKALKARTGHEDESIQAFVTLQQAVLFLNTILQQGDLVLLKGTNTQDHLVRIVLNRITPISCWRQSCRLTSFCNDCSQLYLTSPADVSQSPAGVVGGAAPIAWHPESNLPTLIVGLGNSGAKYINTPHNLGYTVVEQLASTFDGTWETRPEGQTCSIDVRGAAVLVFKPDCAINQSGRAVRKLIDGHKQGFRQCIVVHDDMDLRLGEAKVQRKRGHSSHNGVRSIMASLGTEQFDRVRVGGRSAGDERRPIELVLAQFSEADESVLSKATQRAVQAIRNRCQEIT